MQTTWQNVDHHDSLQIDSAIKKLLRTDFTLYKYMY